MKSREQKRLEAIQRLERAPRNPRLADAEHAALWARRKLEALRLRTAFGERRYAESEEVR